MTTPNGDFQYQFFMTSTGLLAFISPYIFTVDVPVYSTKLHGIKIEMFTGKRNF